MTEKDSNIETLTECYQNFQKALECPICLDVVKRPFILCSRGHLMCVGCLKDLTSCPTCQGQLALETPVCLQSLLEYLPRSCQYSANGCKKIFEDGNEHERFCAFRYITCKAPNCKQDLLVKDLLEHHKTVHPDELVIEEENEMLWWPDFDATEEYYDGNLVYLFDNLFWIALKNNIENKQLEITFEVIPIGKLMGDYYLKVRFSNGEFEYMYTLKAFVAEQNKNIATGDEAESVTGRPDDFCMKVPQVMMPHFIDESGLNFNYELFFKE